MSCQCLLCIIILSSLGRAICLLECQYNFMTCYIYIVENMWSVTYAEKNVWIDMYHSQVFSLPHVKKVKLRYFHIATISQNSSFYSVLMKDLFWLDLCHDVAFNKNTPATGVLIRILLFVI